MPKSRSKSKSTAAAARLLEAGGPDQHRKGTPVHFQAQPMGFMPQQIPQAPVAAPRKGGSHLTPVPQFSGVLKHPYAQMMVDPLDGPLSGRPDSTLGATLVYRLRDLVDVSTNSVGAFALGVAPGSGSGTYVATVTAGTTTITAWAVGTAAQGDAEIIAFPSSRVLTYVVEWFPTSAATVECGTASLVSRNIVTGFPDVGAISQFQDDDTSVVSSATASLAMVARPTDTPTFIVGTGTNPRAYMPTIVFALTGGPVSTTCGKLRITRIVEVLPNSNTLVASAAVNHGCSHCVLECVANAGAAKAAISGAGSDTASAWKQVVQGGLKALQVATKAYATGDLTGMIQMLN